MINNTASLDLVEFVETKILPKYANFDKAHNMEHVTRVIRIRWHWRALPVLMSTWCM